jgi:hypothetical protein
MPVPAHGADLPHSAKKSAFSQRRQQMTEIHRVKNGFKSIAAS